MREFGVLFFRELREKRAAWKPRRENIWSTLFNLVLTAAVLAVVIVVFRYFLETYLKVKIGYTDAKAVREREALTFVYALACAVTTISGIFKINRSITSSKGMNVLLLLPVRRQTIFLSKLAALFTDFALTSLLTVLPLAAVFAFVAGRGFGFFALSIFGALVCALFSFALAALLALPAHFLTKLLSRNYLVLTIVFTALVAGAFLVYSQILSLLKGLLETGRIRFIFNESFLNAVAILRKIFFPGNVLADFTLGNGRWLNLVWALLAAAGSVAVVCLAVRWLFGLVANNRLSGGREFRRVSRISRPHSPLAALLKKEFVTILRTPSFAFQFFAVTLVLPLMVYVTATLLDSLARELIFVDVGFEIALLCTAMFSVLTNTFCATNISREGKSFSATKILPVNSRLLVWSKVLLCGIVSLASILLTNILLAVLGVVNLWQAGVCFLITGSLSVGMICLATRRDLNQPDFGGSNNRAVTFVVFWGLVASLVTGALSLFCAMFFRAKYANSVGTIITVCVLFVLAVLILVLSVLYLNRGLDRKYREVQA